MLLDKYLIKKLNLLGNKIMRKAGLTSAPSNIEQLYCFFKTLKIEAEIKNDAAANMIYQVLYNFVSSAEVRDRHTSPREFEDIFCSIFSTTSTDARSRTNPLSTKEILDYDRFTTEDEWDISSDLSGNKREKADASIGGYDISLKTLKGRCYDEFGDIIDSKFNDEINVGSFSFRALFKGILSDDDLAKLGDRKSGLGSKKQIRNNVLDPIKNNGKTKEFLERLKLFFGYVYEEDLIIIIKSGYRTDIYFIPNETFVKAVCMLYEKNENNFEEVWYRWENNNLRFRLSKLFDCINYFKLPYGKITLSLDSFKTQGKVKRFNQILNKNIEIELENLINEN